MDMEKTVDSCDTCHSCDACHSCDTCHSCDSTDIPTSVYAVTACCLFCLAICLLAGLGLVTQNKRIDVLQSQVEQQQMVIEQMSRDLKGHEEVMTTYAFFNEKWSAVMKGETR